MSPPTIPLTAAQQELYDDFLKVLPNLTNRQKTFLRSRIRSGEQKAKDFRGKSLLTDELFRKEYKSFQKKFKNRGTDSQFAAFLNERYVPRTADTFSTNNVQYQRKSEGTMI